MSENQMTNRVFSIRNVSEQVNVPPGTLRQWEKDFELAIPRTSNNVRYYTWNDVRLLQKIKSMRDNGSSIETIRRVVSGKASESPSASKPAEPAQTAEPTAAEIDRSIRSLNEQLLNVRSLLESLPDTIKAAVEEAVAAGGGKQQKLKQPQAAPAHKPLAEEIRHEAESDLRKAFVASMPAPKKKKKSVWRKDNRGVQKNAGRSVRSQQRVDI